MEPRPTIPNMFFGGCAALVELLYQTQGGAGSLRRRGVASRCQWQQLNKGNERVSVGVGVGDRTRWE